MARFTETGLESKIGCPHRDYDTNLKIAQNFASKVANSLLPGMQVKVCDGEHIKKALLMISWNPARTAKVGNCATPISLHESTSIVNKKIESIFNFYFNTVKEYHQKMQLELIPSKV